MHSLDSEREGVALLTGVEGRVIGEEGRATGARQFHCLCRDDCHSGLG